MITSSYFLKRTTLLAVALMAALRADVGLGVTSLTDSSPPLDSRQVRDRLEALGPLLQMDGEVTNFDGAAAPATATPASSGSSQLPPEVRAQLKGSYETSIAQIQAQIAKLKTDDTSGREMLQGALTRSVQNYKQMFGMLPPGVSEGASAATTVSTLPASTVSTTKPTLKRPVIGNRTLTGAQAIASLKKMLADNSTAQARAAFAASPQYGDAAKSARAAAGALAVNRVTAALAALLRAQELAPKDPEHLYNLAGLSTRLGMPRHALALLDAADTLAGQKSGVARSVRAAALTNRGHALIQLKRFSEAETVLREAARLAPTLREARVNLAHALYQQNDAARKKEAAKTMMFARWRQAQPTTPKTPGPTPPPVPPTGPKPPTKPAEGEDEDELSDASLDAQRQGRPPARAIFDLSRGKPGGLPTIKIPRTIPDGYAMYPKVQKLQADIAARMTGIVNRMIELDDIMRKRERSGAMSAAGAQRARDIFWYIAHTQLEQEYRGLWREVELASRDPGLGLTGGQIDNPWASFELMEKHDRIRAASMRHREYCLAMWAATEPYHGSWQGPIRRMETAINRYYHVTYPHMTALAANLADKYHHEYAMLMIEQKGLAMMGYLLGPLHTVCFFDTHCVEDWGPQGEKGQAEEPQPGQFTVADMCGALSKDGYKAVFDLEIVELSVNCEKVGAELSAGQWVKLFGEVECTYDGEVTIFLGGAVEGEIPFIGVVETGAKAGGYVTIDFEKGVVDAGVKSTESIKVGVGPVGVEREIEHTYVIATFGGGT